MTSPQWHPGSEPQPAPAGAEPPVPAGAEPPMPMGAGPPMSVGAEPPVPMPGPGPQPGAGAIQPYQPDPVLLTIGDISVTRTEVIVPTGRYPLRGTTWTVQDSTQVSESIPAYAIVLAILLFIFCFLGLLFLLIKQKTYTGFISVTVTGPNLFHAAQFPAGPQVAAFVGNQVNQARAMAAAV